MATVMMVMIDGDEEGDGDGDDHNELVNSLLDVALRLRQTLQRLWVLQSLKHVQHLKSTQSESMTNLKIQLWECAVNKGDLDECQNVEEFKGKKEENLNEQGT